MSDLPDPLSLALVLGGLSLVPFAVIITTSFLKISVVIMLVRNALGVQQIPPSMAIYGLSIILTLYIMAPVAQQAYVAYRADPAALSSPEGVEKIAGPVAEPLRQFMIRNSKPENRAFFVSTARRIWPPEMADGLKPTDFFVLAPAFTISELTAAFQIGFLLYLPFVVIDLVVSNILLAMGMMMVSPMTISLPLKLFLFVMVSGWTRLIEGLVLTYVH